MAKQTERKQVTKEITFTLTEEQLLAAGKKAADLRTERLKIEQEFSRVKATYKGRIEEKENELSKILSVIGDGKETRTVTAVEVYDYENAVVLTTVDGEVVEDRGMTADERQMGFRFKTKGQEEVEALPSANNNPKPPAGDPDPVEVQLPAPEKVGQESYVPGEHDRPTKVRYLLETWRQEAGEAATYVVVEDDVFGSKTLLWRKQQEAKTVTEQPADTAATAPSAPGENDGGQSTEPATQPEPATEPQA